GRPTIVIKTLDKQSGVDPYSIVIGYHGVLVAPAEYDPISGIAIIPLPNAAPVLRAGRRQVLFLSSDFQESKNVDTMGSNLLPNTRTIAPRVCVVKKGTATWVLPSSGTCVRKDDDLLVTAGAPDGVKRVRFLLDGRKASTGARGPVHLWTGTLRKLRPGRHVLSAVAVTHRGRSVTARIRVRTCRKR
ncbi:MAG: hypothetical protein ACJ75L_09140, partial [Gaiellaceae bacterium]